MNNYTNPVTVTGNPASFEASGNGKFLSLSVPFSPIQDLHGYANPWPAGGGANILDPDKSSRYAATAYGMDITYLGDDTFTIKGQSTTTSASAAFNVLLYSDTSLSGLGYVVQAFIVNDKNNNYKSCYGYRTSTEKTIAVVLNCSVSQDVDITLKFSVATTSQSSWTPYSNICPISGLTGLSVYRTGKNLFDQSDTTYLAQDARFYGANDNRALAQINTLPAGTYTLSFSEKIVSLNGIEAVPTKFGLYLEATNDGQTFKVNAQSALITPTVGQIITKTVTFTLTDEYVGKFQDFRVYTGKNVSHGVPNEYTANIYDVQIELGSATTYEPYNGNTYSVDWTSEAGTVYGGTLDVVTGVLTVDRAMVVIDGVNKTVRNNGTTSTTSNAWFNGAVGKAYGQSNFISDRFATGIETVPGGMSGRDNSIGIEFRLPVDIPNNTPALNQWFADNPTQLCYELATPITYQLTATQVELLIGQNNVWSDSNEAVTLTYVIELFTRYTFIVNGNDYTGLVERDSYRTAVTPVYGETIQTLDGVGHTALLRVKGSLTVKLNPQTAAQTAAICADLLNAPCEVQYKCLQRNVNVTALMVLDVVSAMFLSRCLYLGQKWNDVDEIVLKEL